MPEQVWALGMVQELIGETSSSRTTPSVGPVYGSLGAAVALVLGRLVEQTIHIVVGARVLGALPMHCGIWKYALAAGAAAAVARLLRADSVVGAFMQL